MKKEYKKPELKEVELKHRAKLLEGSARGEIGIITNPTDFNKA